MAEELYTIVNIGDDEYQIKKFSPAAGTYVALFVVSKLTPMIPLLKNSGGQDLFEAIAVLGNSLGSISEEEIDALYKKCLKVCKKRMANGNWVPCIGDDGNYRVEGLDGDLITTLSLVISAIQWGASDFFGEKLSLLKETFGQITSRLNTKT